MTKSKKKRKRRKPNPLPPGPKLEESKDFVSNRAPYSEEDQDPKGMARAVATLDESLRRPAPRDPLREIDRLTRPKDRRGNA